MQNITAIEFRRMIVNDSPIIVECGANTGETTLEFLEIFPQALVHCFEPDPRCVKVFKKNCGVDSRCVLYEAAISDIDGETTLYLSTCNKPNTTTPHISASTIKGTKRNMEFHSWIRFDKNIIVPTIRLDTWLETVQTQYIDFLWADVEGAEENLILGGMNTLKRTKYFYTEYSNREVYDGEITLDQIVKMLPDFELIKTYEYDALFRNLKL